MNGRLLVLALLAFGVFAGCPLTCNSMGSWCESSGKCVCTDSTCCVGEAGICQADSDCCAGMACSSGACRPAGCLGASSSCSTSSECCSSSCTGGSCACSPNFFQCHTNADCCSGLTCTFGFCK